MRNQAGRLNIAIDIIFTKQVRPGNIILEKQREVINLVIKRKPTIISLLLRLLLVYGHMLEPYLPQTAARIYYLLGVE